MNLLEVISTLRKERGMTKGNASKAVRIFFDSIKEAFEKGDRVEIREFCSFFMKEYKSYTAINPRTKEKIIIGKKRLPFFKCSKKLKEKVNS